MEGVSENQDARRKFCLNELDDVELNLMQTALIYCPNTGGHRHMYAKAFADYFCAKGYQVVFTYCGLLSGETKAWPFSVHESSFIASFANRPDVTMVSLRDCYQPKRQVKLIRSLQEKYHADQTVIIDGDAIQWQLAAQALPWKTPFRNNTTGIFLFSEFMHRGAVALRELFAQWFLHMVLFKHQPILDHHIWLDEVLMKSARMARYVFVPDILSEPEPWAVSEENRRFAERISQKVDAFLKENEQRTPVLLFGELEPRKGSDWLYRLVAEDESLFLIQAGRVKHNVQFPWSQVLARECLLKQGRLLEIPCYIDSIDLVKKLFSIPRIMAMPYREFYRTSGNMLYAVMNGKPVLAPNRGLLALRIKKHGVGLVYDYGDYNSFKERFYNMQSHAETYDEPLKKYASTFLGAGLERMFDQWFEGAEHCEPEWSQVPERTLGELVYWRLFRKLPYVRPLLKIGKRVYGLLRAFAKRMILNIRIAQHECFVRKRWKKLAGKSITIYGAGAHSRWLEKVVKRMADGPEIVAVLDDHPKPELRLFGLPVITPDTWEYEKNSSILLSTDVSQGIMAKKCRESFGEHISLIDLYRDCSVGPYPKKEKYIQ